MAKILLVDDVDLFLELECSYLKGCGYELITASSGEETLRRLDRVAPDLLLLDYYLPGINGDEVCRTVRKSGRWRDLPVLMVTAAGKPEEVNRCLDAGCDDYVTKPVSKHELREKVGRLLGEEGPSRSCERTAAAVREPLQKERPAAVDRGGEPPEKVARLKTSAVLDENATLELRLETAVGKTFSIRGEIRRAVTGGAAEGGAYVMTPDRDARKLLDNLSLGDGPDGPGRVDDELGKRLKTLEREHALLRQAQDDALRRIGELEQENHDFANQLVHVEEVNNNLTNLYIASSRLHSTLDREETLEIIKEVVINFVGAEKFAVLLFDQKRNLLSFETGEGFGDDETFPEIPLGEGILGEAVASAENYVHESLVGDGSDDVHTPIVAIPLIIHGRMIGALAIYRLFIQKEQLESIDYQLFSMLGEHAASALFSSTLYGRSERKRQTYQGVVDLLLR